MFRKRTDRGSLSLEQSLIVSLLVLVAAFTLFTLGDAVMCLYADEAVESAVAGGGPESAASLEYAGRCVDIRHLAAEDNGDGTVTLAWVGGEAPFTLYRSDTELVAFKVPDDPFLGVAHAAGTEVVPDLDGNDYDRVATVEAGYGQTWYQVKESGGDAVVASLVGPAMPRVVRMVAGSVQTYGIREDGSVLATGVDAYGQVSIPRTWNDVSDISCTGPFPAAVRTDGTVVFGSTNSNDLWDGFPSVSTWTDVVEVETGLYNLYGLRADGVVLAAGTNTSGQMAAATWTGIREIAAATYVVHGLRADGTVISAGTSTYGQTSTTGWTGIVELACTANDTYGLRGDGTVIHTGRSRYGQAAAVATWTDIVDIAAGGYWVVGLRSDGTVVAAGTDIFGQVTAAAALTDMVAIDVNAGSHLVGIKSDGTVIAVGVNSYGQCDVASWN